MDHHSCFMKIVLIHSFPFPSLSIPFLTSSSFPVLSSTLSFLLRFLLTAHLIVHCMQPIAKPSMPRNEKRVRVLCPHMFILFFTFLFSLYFFCSISFFGSTSLFFCFPYFPRLLHALFLMLFFFLFSISFCALEEHHNLLNAMQCNPFPGNVRRIGV